MTTTYVISRYLNVRQAYFPSFTSDGRRAAARMSTSFRHDLFEIDLTK